MTDGVNLFSNELTNWLIYESGFNQSNFQMSVYEKYAPDGSKLVVLYYVDDCVYWYTYQEIGYWFLDTLIKLFHVNFLGYAHQFIYISISQLKDHSILVYQSRYSTSVVENYLYTSTIKENSRFNNTILPHDMIFTKEYNYISDKQVEVLQR